MRLILIIIMSVGVFIPLKSQKISRDIGVAQEYVIMKINTIRVKGCKCSGKYYKPVGKLSWSKELEKSAFIHAKSMYENDFFSHYSLDGKDIGQRLDDINYKWHYAGENLAEGQKSFDEALHDWIASPTHCRMLMNPNMKEMALSKYGTYWVQHFGKKMPPKTKRVGQHYSQGD